MKEDPYFQPIEFIESFEWKNKVEFDFDFEPESTRIPGKINITYMIATELTWRERIAYKWRSFVDYMKAINPFDWRIALYRKSANISILGHPENMCKIGHNGKWLYLLDKDNNQLPGQISCTIKDKVNEIPTATITVMVDLREIVKIGNHG